MGSYTFTGPAGDALDAGLTEVSGDWDLDGSGNAELTPAGGSTRSIVVEDAAHPSQDHYAEVVVADLTAANYVDTGPSVRASADGLTYYSLRRGWSSAGSPDIAHFYQLMKVVSGTESTLIDRVSTSAWTLPETVRLEAEGGTLRLYVAGVLVDTYVDPSPLTGSRTGFVGYRSLSSRVVKLSEFTSGVLGGAAAEIVVGDARAGSRAGVPLVEQTSPVTLEGARAAGRSTRPTLTQATTVTVDAARATSRAGRPHLQATGTLPARPARAASRADQPKLAQRATLTVSDARAATRADRPAVVPDTAMPVLPARAPARADIGVLTQHHGLLAVLGARAPTRARRATMPGATGPTTPDARTHTVPAEHRTTTADDNRTHTIPPENRTHQA